MPEGESRPFWEGFFAPSPGAASFKTVKKNGTYVLKGGRYEKKGGFLISDSIYSAFAFVIGHFLGCGREISHRDDQ